MNAAWQENDGAAEALAEMIAEGGVFNGQGDAQNQQQFVAQMRPPAANRKNVFISHIKRPGVAAMRPVLRSDPFARFAVKSMAQMSEAYFPGLEVSRVKAIDVSPADNLVWGRGKQDHPT